jgi:hypothetical protein
MKLPRRKFLQILKHHAGASLSVAAGALDRAVRTSRRDRHYCAAHRAMIVGAAGSAVRH